jgi:hypothetical protein
VQKKTRKEGNIAPRFILPNHANRVPPHPIPLAPWLQAWFSLRLCGTMSREDNGLRSTAAGAWVNTGGKMKAKQMLFPVGLALFKLACRSSAEDKPAATEDKLAPLERFIGEWEVDGKWAGGESLHARGVYEWGLGKKTMKAHTFVRDGEREYQRYEGVLAWHPEKKCLFEISFAFAGAISELVIEPEGKDSLHIGFVPFNPDRPGKVRQVIQLLDKDHLQWVASIKDGEDW